MARPAAAPLALQIGRSHVRKSRAAQLGTAEQHANSCAVGSWGTIRSYWGGARHTATQMPRPAPALHIFTAACGPSEYMRQVLVLVRSVHDTTARRGQPVELHLIHDGGAAARGLLGRLARISADRLLPNLVVSGHQLNGTESTRAESIAHGFGPCSASRLWIPTRLHASQWGGDLARCGRACAP